jgi:uncharacterized membrane protein YbhN (UPF0104 family)
MMGIPQHKQGGPGGGPNWRHVGLGGLGVVLGGFFLWLAVRNINPRDVETALLQMDRMWLVTGVAAYLMSIGLRCLRWGFLLRPTGSVKWRHPAEALITGFAAKTDLFIR